MKKILIGLLGGFGVVLVSVITTYATNKCLGPQTDEDKMREIVEKTLDERFNPVFTYQKEAIAYYERFLDEQITDSFIKDMTQDTFVLIANELIEKSGTCDIKDILKEYLENYSPKYEYILDEESIQ